MQFSEFLAEARKNKTIVFAFGRFNPPTIGHELLIKKVVDLAKQNRADHIIYASRSQDTKKNPLSVQQKITYLHKMFSNVNFAAANEDVRTFIEVAKYLDKQGYKNIIMVAGSDRLQEYQKILDKYNGKEFHFDSVKVVSAGERDPDADGASGMSGTKMRESAIKNDFKSFRSGIPNSLSDRDTKSLMGAIRLAMNVREFVEIDLNRRFESVLVEGVHDKGIFKAVFLAGGPGSGKDYILNKTLDGHGLTEINSDKAFEFLMDKENLDMKMPESEKDVRNLVRGRAKNVTELKQRLALLGRNGLIINGTGDDYDKIKKIKERLEELGYEASMVSVNTADEVSKQRNIERGQRGGRTVPEEIRKEKWDGVQENRPKFAELFGNDYVEFDNSEDLRTAPQEVKDTKEKEMMDIFKRVREFVSKPAKNPNAQEWIANELNKKDALKVAAKGAEKAPHSDSGAFEEAKKLGLQYMGFGRYGKNGKVTHHSVHDKLVEVGKYKFSAQKTVPVSSSGTSSGSFTPKQREKLQDIRKQSKLRKDIKKESIDYQFDTFLEEAVTSTNQKDTPYEKDAYLKDKDTKPRKFFLRNSAAKEAHIKNGEVIKKNGYYLVKLKENQDVSISKEIIQEQKTESSCKSVGSVEALNDSIEKKSFSQIKRKIKTKVNEIDFGTEGGMPLSGYNKEKIDRITGKAVTEMTGDVTGASIGAQKDDELAKQGINLASFRAKKGNVS